VLVIEGLELVQRVQKVLLVPDQGPLLTATNSYREQLNQFAATGLFSAEIEPLWLRNLLPLAVVTAGGLLQAGLLWLCAKAVVGYWSGRRRGTPGAK
jgi:hypothetical protein